MSYTNATFYLDYESGSDTARTALTSVAVANNGSGLVRCTKAAHGLVTGAVVDVTGNYVGAWIITVIDSSHFDLVGSTYSTATGVTVTPRGGSSLADAWKTIGSPGVTAARHAPGDTIRVKASPDPTSIGNATWTDGPLKTTKAIVSSSNATPIVLTLSGANYTALAPAVGDTVIVANHTVNTNANGVWTLSAVNGSTTVTLQDALGGNSVGNGVGGATGTVRKASNMVVNLAAALTKNIALCGNRNQKTNWTASSNITATVITTDYKEGGECQQIDIAAGFTTGLAAYLPITALDLSGYQQVAFWVKQTAGVVGAAGALSLKLCSDAAGATAVNTVSLPALSALNRWVPVVVDTGGALGAAIQSVALYINTDNGAQTFLLDNIIACKAAGSADALNLTSLIGKNSGYEAWFGLQSINGTRVMLDGLNNTIPGASPQRGYSGTTETVATYRRETVKLPMGTVNSIGIFTPTLAGTAGNLITYSGGWDRTAMSSQSGETWFDGQNGYGQIINNNSNYNYLGCDKINFTRCYIGLYHGASMFMWIGSLSGCNCDQSPYAGSVGHGVIGTLSAVQCGVTLAPGVNSVVTTVARADGGVNSGYNADSGSTTGTVLQANNNTQSGVSGSVNSIIGTIAAAHGNGNIGYSSGVASVCGSLTANVNTNYGLSCTQGCRVLGGSTTGNGQAGVQGNNVLSMLRNFTANEATPFVVNVLNNGVANATIFSERHGGVADAHLIFMDGGTIISATDQRHMASGISWKFRPTSIIRSSLYPMSLSVAKIACAANVAVNVSVWTRRDNTNIVGQLLVRGGQLAGVPSDVSVSCAPSINTWTQSGNLTFTPTETGVVELLFQVYDGVGTTNNFWIDDLVVA
jgi:hypothetical protein